MSKISEVKKELRHKEWSEEIRACQSSGMKVKDWCYMKGIKPDTYYHHLRVLREEVLKKCSDDQQQIVPVSVSCEVSGITAANQDINIDRAISPATVTDDVKNIMIRKDGIEIELPQKTSEEMILALLRGLRKC